MDHHSPFTYILCRKIDRQNRENEVSLQPVSPFLLARHTLTLMNFLQKVNNVMKMRNSPPMDIHTLTLSNELNFNQISLSQFPSICEKSQCGMLPSNYMIRYLTFLVPKAMIRNEDLWEILKKLVYSEKRLFTIFHIELDFSVVSWCEN